MKARMDSETERALLDLISVVYDYPVKEAAVDLIDGKVSVIAKKAHGYIVSLQEKIANIEGRVEAAERRVRVL